MIRGIPAASGRPDVVPYDPVKNEIIEVVSFGLYKTEGLPVYRFGGDRLYRSVGRI